MTTRATAMSDGNEPLVTPAQQRVLVAVANGLSNKQIGLLLNCREETVKKHLRATYERLEANNRAHAVAIAMREGIVI